MRDSTKATIPIGLLAFFWINVAAWVHLGAGVAGYEVALKHDDEKALTTFAENIGTKIDRKQAPTEIDVVTDGTTAPPVDTAPPPAPKPLATQDQPKPKPLDPKQDQPKKPQDEPKKDDPKVAVVKPVDTAVVPPPPPPPKKDQRIAVKQHVKPNQTDDPNAHFIADEANHTEDETVATVTAHDRDDPNPKPAGDHQNASKDPGDSDDHRIADSDQHQGQANKAPGEKGTEFDVIDNQPQDHPMAPVAVQGPTAPTQAQSGGDGKVAGGNPAVVPPELAPGNAAPPSPNVVDSPNGGWTFSIARAPGSGTAQDTGPGSTSRTLQPPPTPTTRPYGLGGNPGPGQVNLNLDNKGVIAVIGRDQLRRDREGDGERRLAEHRGSWTSSSFDKWRPAIENYVSSVKPGNQTALNTAAVPFASYLNGMHNRIHPIFADSFLGSLDSLPPTNPLNDPKLVTRLEIVLTRDGHITKMGIVKTSGVTAFDIAALDSVQRASPFGPAPNAIVSTDGAVYLHWEFHRDEVYACSTMNARPFMLNNPAGAPPVDPNPKTPTGPQEKGPPPGGGDTREGLFLLAPKKSNAG